MPSRHLLVFFLLAVPPLSACAPAEKEGDDAGECSDGIDQDGDNLVDCDDIDCPWSLCAPAEGDVDTDSDSDSDTDADTDVEPPCEVTIDSTWPVQGAADFYWRDPIEFDLSDADPSAFIMSDIPGTSSLSDDRETVIYQPDAPLSPDTDYSVTLDYCSGVAELDFRTGPIGDPVPNPSDLVDRTWLFSLADARAVYPEGIGSVFLSYVDGDSLVSVTSADSAEISLRLGVADSSSRAHVQDTSFNTAEIPSVDFTESPFASGGPIDGLTVGVAGYAVPLDNLRFSGTFSADGSTIEGIVIAFDMDTRPLAPLLDDSGDEAAICDLAVNFGVECEPCASDGEPFCLSFLMDRIEAEEVSAGPVVPVTGGSDGCASSPVVPPLAWLGLVAIARRRRRVARPG